MWHFKLNYTVLGFNFLLILRWSIICTSGTPFLFYQISLFCRHAKGKSHLETLAHVRQLCKDYGVLFKLNTVVNKYNINDDMGKEVRELTPIRWKVFQCLSIYAENEGPGALKQVSLLQCFNNLNWPTESKNKRI